jgi:hypothetical protein
MRTLKLKGPVAVALDADTITDVESVARAVGISRNAVLRQAILRGLPEVSRRWRGFANGDDDERRFAATRER